MLNRFACKPADSKVLELKMKAENSQLFYLVTGMVIYALDITSDVWLAVQYCLDEESKWFGLTITFILVTILITNIAECLQTSNHSFDGPCKRLWIFFFCCPNLFRYIEELYRWKQVNTNTPHCEEEIKNSTCSEGEKRLERKQLLVKSVNSLAWLHLLHSLTESGPQFCLQGYIMLEKWNFPCVTVLSAFISFVSLTWSIASLEQAHKGKDSDRIRTLGSSCMFLAWQFFAIISRLSAIVVCACVLQYHLLWVLLFHWFLVTIAMVVNGKEEFEGESVGAWIGMFFASLFTVHPFLVFASEPLLASFSKDRDLLALVTSVLLCIQNVFMLSISAGVSMLSEESRFEHVDILLPISVGTVFGGMVLSTVFCVGYYRCCFRDTKEYEGTKEALEYVDNNGISLDENSFDEYLSSINMKLGRF